MKLVIDDKIPFMRGYAERLGDVVYLPGAQITAEDVRDADALIVRTRTRCDKTLLEGSKVKFVATATIGYDHINTADLAEMGIAWTNCPGCNAHSVAQYVESSLLLLAAKGAWNGERGVLSPDAPIYNKGCDLTVFSRLTIGIVGVGHVGREVEQMARRLGFGQILLCDPPRAEQEGKQTFTLLEELAERSDVVTFHTPLTRSPHPYPTYHLASADFFRKLRDGAVFFNSSRGEVADTQAVKAALASGRLRAAVIDTWENEPNIDRELLDAAFISTPHIAGYSADGKANGTRMSLAAVAQFFGMDSDQFDSLTPPPLPPDFSYYPQGEGKNLDERLRLYDPLRDSTALKQHPESFETLRGNYPLRRETAV